jgi:hypothetical protein
MRALQVVTEMEGRRMDSRTAQPPAFSVGAAAILAEAARLAEDDASGSVPEAHAGGSVAPVVTSGAHLLAALDGETATFAPGVRVPAPTRSTPVVQRILAAAASAAMQASADEITPDHLRAGMAAVLRSVGIDPEGLRRARVRAHGLAPSNLGCTALRHRDVSSARVGNERSLTS